MRNSDGWCALSEIAEVSYKVTEKYSPEHEGGIVWNDPDIAIAWPIRRPILSSRELALRRLKELEIASGRAGIV